MGIFGNILRRNIVGGGNLSAYNDFWYGASGGSTKAGVQVNEETSIKYLAVFACVSLIAGDIARLPLILYQRSADGSKKRVLNHPLSDLLHNAPNPDTTSFNWRELSQTNLLLWGNTYSEIKRTNNGNIIQELIQMPSPGEISVKITKKGKIYYEWNVQGKGIRRLLKKNVFHIPGFGFNGMVGKSMIKIAREAIGLGMAAEQFGSQWFGEGIHPTGVLETDNNLGDNRKEFINAARTGYAGLGNASKLMVLESGMKFKSLSIPAEDSQFLQTKDHQKIEICGMYHVPPHKIAIHGQNSNYNNLEQENMSYVDSCLMHWIVRWEQNIALQLLTPVERKKGLFVEFLVAGLLRGDSKARSEYYNTMFQVGAMSPNEILAKENMNPLGKEGDQHFVQLNMIPLDMAGEFVKNENNQSSDKEEKTFREYRESNSISVRDRVAKQYLPLFFRAAQDIVNRESIAVKKQVKKQQKSRANEDMQKWLDDFYRTFPAYIKTKICPVFRSFSEAIQAVSAEEMGLDIGISDDLETFIDDYSNRYAERHVESSLGQLTAELITGLEALTVRVDEWQERRPDKIAVNETTRNSNAIYQTMAFGTGLSTVLRNRGPKTCPFCKSLAGKRVSRGGAPLVADGEELKGGKDDAPMLIRGSKFHPPIHRKCLPGDSVVTAFGVTASSEDWFDGNLFVIHTATGNKVSCTPNHPVLTCHGWMPANKIEIGDCVLKTVDANGDVSIICDSKNMPTLIKNVAKSFIDLGKMIAIPVPATAEDFNSDECRWDSKITIIRADGSLLFERDPSLFHKLRKFNLSLRDSGKFLFTSDSSFTEFIKARFPSECCLMSSRNLLLSLGGGHAPPIEQSSFTLPSTSNPMDAQVLVDNEPGHSEPFGNRINGLPIDILRDEVIGIENNAFHGLVYNLHTKDNLFYAENIVVHNCDCYMSVV